MFQRIKVLGPWGAAAVLLVNAVFWPAWVLLEQQFTEGIEVGFRWLWCGAMNAPAATLTFWIVGIALELTFVYFLLVFILSVVEYRKHKFSAAEKNRGQDLRDCFEISVGGGMGVLYDKRTGSISLFITHSKRGETNSRLYRVSARISGVFAWNSAWRRGRLRRPLLNCSLETFHGREVDIDNGEHGGKAFRVIEYDPDNAPHVGRLGAGRFSKLRWNEKWHSVELEIAIKAPGAYPVSKRLQLKYHQDDQQWSGELR